jgi:hypothetical protein
VVLRLVLPPFLPAPAFATLSTPRPRILTLNNLHTGESLKAEFFDGRGYIQDELARLNHFFRDFRANKIKPSIQDCLINFIACRACWAPANLSSLFWLSFLDTNNELRAAAVV